MFKWLARLFTKPAYPFEVIPDEVLAETWGGDPMSALIIGGAGLLGSGLAAHTQASAANRATDAQSAMYQQTREDQAPWRAAGGTSLSEIMKQFGLGEGGDGKGYFNHQFGPEDLKAGLAPNYDFMLAQGQGATANMANAMGGLGGNSLKAINDYTQNYAQNAYQQAFNNYTSNQTNIFNRLASIAGLGQTAGANSTTGGSQYGQGIANSMQGAGNANAAGIMGGANAIGQGMGWYSLSNFLRGPTGAGAGGSTIAGPGSSAGLWEGG